MTQPLQRCLCLVGKARQTLFWFAAAPVLSLVDTRFRLYAHVRAAGESEDDTRVQLPDRHSYTSWVVREKQDPTLPRDCRGTGTDTRSGAQTP
jgi:hypothetical protein